MARKSYVDPHKKYIKSGCWKCDKAPINSDIPLQVKHNSGAHYWVLHDTIWVCKYCGDARKWPMTFNQAMEEQYPGSFHPVILEPNPRGLADRNLVPMKKVKWRQK